VGASTTAITARRDSAVRGCGACGAENRCHSTEERRSSRCRCVALASLASTCRSRGGDIQRHHARRRWRKLAPAAPAYTAETRAGERWRDFGTKRLASRLALQKGAPSSRLLSGIAAAPATSIAPALKKHHQHRRDLAPSQAAGRRGGYAGACQPRRRRRYLLGGVAFGALCRKKGSDISALVVFSLLATSRKTLCVPGISFAKVRRGIFRREGACGVRKASCGLLRLSSAAFYQRHRRGSRLRLCPPSGR